MFDGFRAIDDPPHRPRRPHARHHSDVVGPPGVGARRGLCRGATRVPAVGGVPPRGARLNAELGDALVLSATKRAFLAPRRIATREASQFHPAEGLEPVVACGVSARRLFDFQARGTPRTSSPDVLRLVPRRIRSWDLVQPSLRGPFGPSYFTVGCRESGLSRTRFEPSWGTLCVLTKMLRSRHGLNSSAGKMPFSYYAISASCRTYPRARRTVTCSSESRIVEKVRDGR